jgi:hypothetical protein
MELRSCYFCGVAGRTVQSRPVSGVDVTLCPRCEEKLARLRAATDGDLDATGATPVTFDAPAPGVDESAAETPAPASESADAETTASDDATGVRDDADDTAVGTADERPGEDADPADERPSNDGQSSGLRGLGAADRGSQSTYRKALRLLRNREFPMARSDTVDLLSSAYDLDREECERLLDLCVDRGLLAEEDGELREP